MNKNLLMLWNEYQKLKNPQFVPEGDIKHYDDGGSVLPANFDQRAQSLKMFHPVIRKRYLRRPADRYRRCCGCRADAGGRHDHRWRRCHLPIPTGLSTSSPLMPLPPPLPGATPIPPSWITSAASRSTRRRRHQCSAGCRPGRGVFL